MSLIASEQAKRFFESASAHRLPFIVLTARTGLIRRAKPWGTLRRASTASTRAKTAERSGGAAENRQKPSNPLLISATPKPEAML
jgi:hypothetical protein